MARSFYTNENERRTASKENLNQYLKTTSVLPLMMLLGVVIILAGMLVLVVNIGLETDITVVTKVEQGIATCYATEQQIESNGRPAVGSTVYVNGTPCVVTAFDDNAFQPGPDSSTFALHLLNVDEDDWIYEFIMEGDLADGVYRAEVVIGKTTAAKLLMQ